VRTSELGLPLAHLSAFDSMTAVKSDICRLIATALALLEVTTVRWAECAVDAYDATRCALAKDEVGDCVGTAVCIGEPSSPSRGWGAAPRAQFRTILDQRRVVARLSPLSLTTNERDRNVPHGRIGLGAMPMALTSLDVCYVTDVDLSLFMFRGHDAGARRHD
jgi:hypothetical protein